MRTSLFSISETITVMMLKLYLLNIVPRLKYFLKQSIPAMIQHQICWLAPLEEIIFTALEN